MVVLRRSRGGLVAHAFEVECVVGAHFAFFFKVKEFFVEPGGLQVTVQAETVDGFHPQCRVLALVVGVFDPEAEALVELFQGMGFAQVTDQKLVTDGAEKAFDFSLRGAVAHGCVQQEGSQARAEGGKFF